MLMKAGKQMVEWSYVYVVHYTIKPLFACTYMYLDYLLIKVLNHSDIVLLCGKTAVFEVQYNYMLL